MTRGPMDISSELRRVGEPEAETSAVRPGGSSFSAEAGRAERDLAGDSSGAEGGPEPDEDSPDPGAAAATPSVGATVTTGPGSGPPAPMAPRSISRMEDGAPR